MRRTDVKGIHRTRKKRRSNPTITDEYHYAWRGGPRFWKSTDDIPKYGPVYWQRYDEAVRDASPASGKFRQVIQDYLNSRQHAALGFRTKKDYAWTIGHPNGIDARFGHAPVSLFNDSRVRRFVYDWRDEFDSDRVADMMRGHLVKIVSWAVDRGIIKINHLANMKARYSVDRSELSWTQQEIEDFIAIAPPHLQRAIIAASETGLRPGDLIRLGRQHIEQTPRGRRIRIRPRKTAKTGTWAYIPVTERMEKLIDETPRDQLIFIVGAKGQPYKDAASVGKSAKKIRNKIDTIRPELHWYDMRSTAATRLLEAGATLAEIGAAMGWTPKTAAEMIQNYVAANPSISDSLLLKLR